jgi:hypothetical protein
MKRRHESVFKLEKFEIEDSLTTILPPPTPISHDHTSSISTPALKFQNSEIKYETNPENWTSPHNTNNTLQTSQNWAFQLTDEDRERFLCSLTSAEEVSPHAIQLCMSFGQDQSLTDDLKSIILRKLNIKNHSGIPSEAGIQWATCLIQSDEFYKNLEKVDSDHLAEIVKLGGENAFVGTKNGESFIYKLTRSCDKNVRLAVVTVLGKLDLDLMRLISDPVPLVRKMVLQRVVQLCKQEKLRLKNEGSDAFGANEAVDEKIIVGGRIHSKNTEIGLHESMLSGKNTKPVYKFDLESIRSTYSSISKILDTDDQSIVRRYAMEAVAELSLVQPDTQLEIKTLIGKNDFSKSFEKIRLVDDAFSRISSGLSDNCVANQVFAADCLGTFDDAIGIEYLLQTLDKKIMSNLRMRQSYNDKERGSGILPEFATGNKWGNDGVGKLARFDASSINIIDASACGAFTHGLESESSKVRLASINSLTTLTIKKNHVELAKKALDALIDMLNDEIEEVRLYSVDGVTTIMKNSDESLRTLYSDQFQNIIVALDDSVSNIRSAVRKLLGACKIREVETLNKVVMQLLRNLQKYPGDRDGIWRTFTSLGDNHPSLTQALTNHLLKIHPLYDTQEPNLEDSAYIGVLLMILKAARALPAICTMTPKFLPKHYQYLRHSMPKRVDRIAAFETIEENINYACNVDPERSSKNSVLRNEEHLVPIFKVDSSKYLYNLISENLFTLGDLIEIKTMIHEYIQVTDKKSVQFGSARAIYMFIDTIQSLQNSQDFTQVSSASINHLKTCFFGSKMLTNYTLELFIRTIVLKEPKKVLEIITKPGYLPLTDLTKCMLQYTMKRQTTGKSSKKFSKYVETLIQYDNLFSVGTIQQMLLELSTEPIKEVFAEMISPSLRSDHQLSIIQGLGCKIPVIAKLHNFHYETTENTRVTFNNSDVFNNLAVFTRTCTDKVQVFSLESDCFYEECDDYLEETFVKLDSFVDLTPVIPWPNGSLVEIGICIYEGDNSDIIELCKPVKVPFGTKNTSIN